MSDADADGDQPTIRQSLLIQRIAAVGSLAEGLAHEVHNPLNCALLQLAVLQRRLEQPDCEPATLQPVALLVEQALRRLELLFNDFVSLQPRSEYSSQPDEP
jgi:signal transduction histidine kinase